MVTSTVTKKHTAEDIESIQIGGSIKGGQRFGTGVYFVGYSFINDIGQHVRSNAYVPIDVLKKDFGIKTIIGAEKFLQSEPGKEWFIDSILGGELQELSQEMLDLAQELSGVSGRPPEEIKGMLVQAIRQARTLIANEIEDIGSDNIAYR